MATVVEESLGRQRPRLRSVAGSLAPFNVAVVVVVAATVTDPNLATVG